MGTPFFLFTNGNNPRALFANAYAPDTPITGGAGSIGTSSATVVGVDNPKGAAVRASFQFGTTSAYGQSTAPQTLTASNSGSLFTARLTGLAAATTIHYRAVVTSDFGTFVGADRTLRTASNPPPPPPPPPVVDGHASAAHAKVLGNTARVRISCQGQSTSQCRLTLTLAPKAHQRVLVGSAHVSLTAGQSRTVDVGLNRYGRKLLKQHHSLKATLRITQTLANGHTAGVSTQTVVFTRAKHRHGH